ncbi:MAG: hypothetical protein ACRD59_01030 [Candidatus Acidiferrales bacterium]
MEKQIMRLSYGLCLLCAVLAVVTRCLQALNLYAALFAGRPYSIGYHSFLDGAILFFMTTVATACFVWVKKESQ